MVLEDLGTEGFGLTESLGQVNRDVVRQALGRQHEFRHLRLGGRHRLVVVAGHECPAQRVLRDEEVDELLSDPSEMGRGLTLDFEAHQDAGFTGEIERLSSGRDAKACERGVERGPGIEVADLRQRHVLDPTRPARGPIERPVVDHHELAILRVVHVALDHLDAELDRPPIRLQRVLRDGDRMAAVGDDQWPLSADPRVAGHRPSSSYYSLLD